MSSKHKRRKGGLPHRSSDSHKHLHDKKSSRKGGLPQKSNNTNENNTKPETKDQTKQTTSETKEAASETKEAASETENLVAGGLGAIKFGLIKWVILGYLIFLAAYSLYFYFKGGTKSLEEHLAVLGAVSAATIIPVIGMFIFRNSLTINKIILMMMIGAFVGVGVFLALSPKSPGAHGVQTAMKTKTALSFIQSALASEKERKIMLYVIFGLVLGAAVYFTWGGSL